MPRSVVLGADSSTQSTKVIAVDTESGEIVGEGRAPHSGLDIQHPSEWWHALVAATRSAVSPDMRVEGLSVDGQQHGMVVLDADDEVIRPAPLWNNVAAAPDAERLNAMADFGHEVGTRLVASITIAKLAHLARTAPDDLARTAAVGLPHDWLNLQLTGNLATDRGEASGSGWWSPRDGRERRDLLALAVGAETAERLRLPEVRGPEEPAGTLHGGCRGGPRIVARHPGWTWDRRQHGRGARGRSRSGRDRGQPRYERHGLCRKSRTHRR